MIPKKIHYCWFGRGEKPKLAKKCMESWVSYLPDYEIKEWNEDNFDLDKYPYVREAYDNRKYAFVTDVVRLYALYNEGGIYMDTDVEVLKSLDSLLQYKAAAGFESAREVSTGVIASEAAHPVFKVLLDEYDGIHFVKPDGDFDCTTNVVRITKKLADHGLVLNGDKQAVADFSLLPRDYLCAKSPQSGKITVTPNTLTIHHFAGSWQDSNERIRTKIKQMLGVRLTDTIVRVMNIFR